MLLDNSTVGWPAEVFAMTVVRFVPRAQSDTIEVADALHCGAVDGVIRSMAVIYRTADGKEHVAFTGVYAENPAAGVNAAMKLSWKLTQAQDSGFGP
jgi:hypothetical protein